MSEEPARQQQLLEAFAAFTEASEQLQRRYEALQGQLGQLQDELQTVLEAVPFGIWVTDEAGDTRFTNRPEGLDGRFLDGPAPWQPGTQPGLRRYRDAENREHFLEQEHRPTGRGGQIITLRDVTEALMRAQQASREERLQAMGLVAAELAHEIRNPLGSLALFAGMLVEDLADRPEQRDLAVRIQGSVHRLNGLVSNALTFSRDLQPKPEALPLKRFWEEARAGSGMPEAIAWENAVGDKAQWFGDPDLLRQVAVNVLQNAAKAMEERPGAKVRVRAVKEAVEGAPHWHLTVEDRGCGIPKDALARVFDPFFTTFGGGTGLGLAVCHRIVQASGGLLFLESEVGMGTTVHLRLPAGPPKG